jgi:hypothetical protein
MILTTELVTAEHCLLWLVYSFNNLLICGVMYWRQLRWDFSYISSGGLKEKFAIHIYMVRRGLIRECGCLKLDLVQVIIDCLLILYFRCWGELWWNYFDIFVWPSQLYSRCLLHHREWDIKYAVSIYVHVTLIIIMLTFPDFFVKLVNLIECWGVISVLNSLI